MTGIHNHEPRLFGQELINQTDDLKRLIRLHDLHEKQASIQPFRQIFPIPSPAVVQDESINDERWFDRQLLRLN